MFKRIIAVSTIVLLTACASKSPLERAAADMTAVNNALEAKVAKLQRENKTFKRTIEEQAKRIRALSAERDRLEDELDKLK